MSPGFDRAPGSVPGSPKFTLGDGNPQSYRWSRSTVQTAEQIVSATIPCSVAQRRITLATFGSGRLDSATFYRSVYLSSRARSECQHIFHPFSRVTVVDQIRALSTPIHTPHHKARFTSLRLFVRLLWNPIVLLYLCQVTTSFPTSKNFC